MRSIFEISEQLNTHLYEEREQLIKSKIASFINVFEVMECVNNSDKPLESMIPDTDGADRLFIKAFLDDELWIDFWYVFRDYLKQNYQILKNYTDIASLFEGEMYKESPESYVKEYLFSYIYCAAKAGDEYSVALLKYLYKKYYKKEYNQLKRFRKISAREVHNFTDKKDKDYSFVLKIARIIGICPIMGIEFERDIAGVFALLKSAWKDICHNEKDAVLEFEEGMYYECLEQIDEWLMEKNYVEPLIYKKANDFIDMCFKRHGFGNDFLDVCDYTGECMEETFAQTLAILKLLYPKKEFNSDEVEIYAGLYKLTDILANTIREYKDIPNVVLGLESKVLGGYDISFSFGPDVVKVSSKPQKEIEVKPSKITVLPFENMKETNYLEEISLLKGKLREKDGKLQHFKMQMEQAKAALKEANDLIKKYENDRIELISLRNHVYSQSIDDIEESEVNLSEMKKRIENKKIAVVGGHTNFINKMRKEFPAWKFYDANITKTNELIALAGIEKLYFFTDHMSHCVYSKYVANVRNNNIPFGYIHTVNLQTIIKQLHKELC